MKKIILTTAILASLALGFGGATTAHADTLLDEVINTIKNSDYADTEDVQATLEETVDKADISGITGAENTEEQANNIVDAFSTSDLEAQNDGIFNIATKITGNLSEAIKYQKESTENLIIKSINTITVLVNGNADEQLEKEALTKDMSTVEKLNYNLNGFEKENKIVYQILKNGAIAVISLTTLGLLIKSIPFISEMIFENTENKKYKQKAKEDAVRGLGLTLDDIIWLILLPFKLVILPFKLAFYLTTFVVLAFKTAYKIIKIQYNWLSQLFLVIKSKPVYSFKKIK